MNLLCPTTKPTSLRKLQLDKCQAGRKAVEPYHGGWGMQ